MKALLEELKRNSKSKCCFANLIKNTIKKNSEILDEIKEQTKFLDEYYENITLSQRVYHIWTGEGIHICPICCKKVRKSKYTKGKFVKYNDTCDRECTTIKTQATNLEKYGHISPFDNPEIQAKIQATNLERYGHISSLSNPDIKAKIQATNLEKYGHTNPMGNPDVQAKKEATNLKKYGYVCSLKNSTVWDKMEATNLEKYGHTNPMGNPDVQAKKEATNLDKYGHINPWQSIEFRKKHKNSGFKIIEFTAPSGNIFSVQGKCELHFLKKYFLENNPEQDILNEPFSVSYFLNNKKHKYFPDFYIIPENKIVEVKSTYYMKLDFEKNLAKRQACLDAGYNFEFVIYDGKHNRLDTEEFIKNHEAELYGEIK